MKILLVLLTLGLVGLLILGWMIWEWGDPWLWPHRLAIFDAFDGHVDLSAGGRYRFECGSSWNCEDVLPQLPPASDVTCVQRMKSSGACCIAEFGGLYQSEIHIYRQSGGAFTIRPVLPYCRNPEYEPSVDRISRRGQRFVPCLEHWGVERPHPVARR